MFKVFLAVPLAFIVSQSALATVVKPSNTSDQAIGAVTVNTVNFSYAVLDRGWLASGSVTLGAQGSGILKAEKSFLIEYESPSKDVTDDQATIQSLGSDVARKCEELGQIEYPGQVKSLPAGYKAALSSSIANVALFNEKGFPFEARFVCTVKITAQSNK